MSVIDRRHVLLSLLATAWAGTAAAQAPPPRKPAPRAGRLIGDARLNAQVHYAVFDRQGNLCEARGGDRPVAPASTLKVLTTLYALDRLGPQARFATRVERVGNTLVLIGGGDPTLDTDGLADLADLTAAAWTGTKPERFEVTGAQLPYIAEISAEQADHLAYNPSVSGMMLNFNRVHLSWRAGGSAMALEAQARRNNTPAYTIRAGAVGEGPLFSWREEGGREIWSVNRAGLRRAGSRWLPVRRPEAYAGDVFQTLCRARGLVLPAPEVVGATAADTVPVARIESAPLTDILRDMMKYSTNLTAEAIGLHASGARDLPASARAMQAWAEARGIEGLDLHDHSGMSPDNRVSARAMAQIIARLGGPAGLRDLMKQVSIKNPDGAGGDLLLEEKTGTLNFVSNLAGYGHAAGQGEVIFAIFIADMDRRAQTEGQELPAGVSTWTQRAKQLQQQLIRSWVSRYGADRG
ncbi:MAG: D-alanyl-D-alanine carboxypeptidase [Paracoccus sp. (in: a-proteobacteria)]